MAQNTQDILEPYHELLNDMTDLCDELGLNYVYEMRRLVRAWLIEHGDTTQDQTEAT